MPTLWLDLKYGLRMLAKNPGFTAVTVLTLALGIGANTAIFSVVDAVLLKPLPFRDSSRLMILHEANPRQPRVSVAYPNFFDWQRQNRVFEEMASFQSRDFNLAGMTEPENIGGSAISSNLFRTLGSKPYLGRDFRPDEDKKGAEAVVILGFRLWQRRFGGEAGAVGRAITLDGRRFTIVGVMPPELMNLGDAELYTPIGVWMDAAMMERGSHNDTIVIARLKPGATPSEAQAEMDAIAARLAAQYPETNTGYRVIMSPIRDEFVGDSGPPILVLFAAVGFVLLIACVNVANLFLAKGSGRSREFAIRSALGASRRRLVRQLLTEGAALAVAGGGLGLLAGAWGLKGLLALVPQDLGMGIQASINPAVLAFTACLSLATVAIFALAPALEASKPDPNETLKEGGRTASGGASRRRLRSALVVSEIALAVVLLVSAGLLIKSFHRLLTVDPGFNPDNALTMQVNLRGAKYAQPDAVALFCSQALGRIRALPGVKFAALGNQLPMTGSHSRGDITIEGQPLPAIGYYPHPDEHSVSPDYFQAMGIPLIRGRSFEDSDSRQAPGVVVISESLARRFWPDGEAVGKRILQGHSGSHRPWLTVVGVVGDTKQYGLGAETRWEVYFPYLQRPPSDFRLIVRSSQNPDALAAPIKNEVHGLDKDVPVHDEATMQRIVADSLGTRRMTALLLGLFAAVAMALAAVGIYGVISYSVMQRAHEFGVRMALGAEPAKMLRLVVGKGVVLALEGVGAGLAISLALTRFLSSLLFGVRPADPVILAGVPLLLLAVAVLASYVPARRAAKLDPIVALRYE